MSTELAEQAAERFRFWSWSGATMVSVLIGLALAGIMTAAMFWIGDYYRGPQRSRSEAGRQTLQELQAAEQQDLQNYGWVNRSEGTVRIPVDRAMQLLVEEARRGQADSAEPPGDSSSLEKRR